MEKPRMPFWDAYHLWKTGGRTITGDQITIWFLAMLAAQAVWTGTVEFFTHKAWGWVWKKKDKKDGE